MENKDYIKDLFKDRFSDFEEKVDSSVWNNIQSQLTVAPPATSVVATTSIVSKLLIAAITIGAISTVSYFVLNEDPNNKEKQTTEAVNEPIVESEIIKSTSISELEKENKSSKEEAETKTVIVKYQKEQLVNSAEYKKDTKEVNVFNKNQQENVNPDSQEQEVKTRTNIVSKAPKSINIEEQSRVVASPMGGVAPLEVYFESLANVKAIKWKFDDGTESKEVSPNHVYDKPGIYFVTMLAQLEDGTNVMDKAVIEVKEALVDESVILDSSELNVPNIFTPNNDGENDAFFVSCIGIESFTISIYSVNGDLVFSSDNPENKWNGTDLRGNYLEDGVYYYLINAIGSDQKVYAPKGYITLRK